MDKQEFFKDMVAAMQPVIEKLTPEQLEEVYNEFFGKAEETKTLQPHVDSQGRIISVPDGREPLSIYFINTVGGLCVWPSDCLDAPEIVAQGAGFISEEAAQAEVTRRKCIQRLRGMDGFDYDGAFTILAGDKEVWEVSFYESEQKEKAEKSLTQEETDAFNYKCEE